jgi:putative ABC transport system permease protein
MELAPSRLSPRDVLSVGSVGLSARKLRAALSALGIAIGIAAMVAVLAISESSKADLLSSLDRLGTNLLTVSPGQSIFGAEATLPETARAMVGRIGPVEEVSATGSVSAVVYRSELSPTAETKGISVLAADPSLPATLGATLADGVFLDDASGRYPAVVLGSTAARRLGITRAGGGVQVVVGGMRFTVVGILDPVEFVPTLDSAALVGFEAAERYLGDEGDVASLYVRGDPEDVEDVRGVLARTANPEHPDEVDVTRPSDAIEARAAAKSAFTSLFLGLGAVALLVGGVGIANVMVISVLERRSEIGLRRALGATRRHVGIQFLAESLLLSLAGGVAGVVLGAIVAACSPHWPWVPSPASTRRSAPLGSLPSTRCARCESGGSWLPGLATCVPAEEDVGGDPVGNPLEERAVGIAVDPELADDAALVTDSCKVPSRRVGCTCGRAEDQLALLDEGDPGPRHSGLRDQRADDGAECLVGVGGGGERLLDRCESGGAHSTRSAPSKARIGSRAASGMGVGRRVSRSTNTSVCVAVTMSASSATRIASHS